MLSRRDTSESIAICKRNLEALFRFHGLPLIAAEEMEVDRIKGLAPGLAEALDAHPAFRKWDEVKNKGPLAIRGWREFTARWSLQVVLFRFDRYGADVDHFNPDFGLGPALLHFGEVLIPGKTDPAKVARGLRKRGVIV